MNSLGVGAILKRLHRTDDNEEAPKEKKPKLEEPKPEKPPFKYNTGLEKNKLFVRCDYKCTEGELKEVFDKYGHVTDVRIVKHKSGAPKGVAYVEFEKEEDAEKALTANDTKLYGRKIKVLLSDPPSKEEAKAKLSEDMKIEKEAKVVQKPKKKPDVDEAESAKNAGNNTGLQKNKLFVRCDYNCTEEELKEIFDKYGQVTDVHVVKHKSGAPKGFAYVGFERDEGAEKALSANGTKLHGRKMKVVLSDPPSKEEAKDKLPEDVNTEKEAKVAQKQKKEPDVDEAELAKHFPKIGQLSMVPRSLFKKNSE